MQDTDVDEGTSSENECVVDADIEDDNMQDPEWRPDSCIVLDTSD